MVGEENLRNELRGHGLTILDEYVDQDPKEVIDPAGIDAVVVRHESQDHRGMAWPEVASDRELPGTFDLREEMGRRGLL